MPRLWAPNLGSFLGKNLKDDETNVRYGVYILRHFARRTGDSLDAGELTRSALLSYNGCVRGTNTPDCKAYPAKVQRHVEHNALSSCNGRAFHDCVALPLWAAVRDTTPPPSPSASLAGAQPLVASDRPRDVVRSLPFASKVGHWLSSSAPRGGN